MVNQPKQTGTVHFTSDPSRADIYVDGQKLVDPKTEESIKTPATVQLIEGRRDFRFSLPGYQDESGYVDVLPNTTVSINRNLKSGKSGEGWGTPQPQINLENLDKEIYPDEIKEIGEKEEHQQFLTPSDANNIDFARVLDSEIVSLTDKSCMVSKMRILDLSIGEGLDVSHITQPLWFFYQKQQVGKEEKYMDLGEIAVLEGELEPLLSFLNNLDIETRVVEEGYNSNPKLYRIHVSSDKHPLTFAMTLRTGLMILNR